MVVLNSVMQRSPIFRKPTAEEEKVNLGAMYHGVKVNVKTQCGMEAQSIRDTVQRDAHAKCHMRITGW